MLYWRIKKNGKWTWVRAQIGSRIIDPTNHLDSVWGYFVQEEQK